MEMARVAAAKEGGGGEGSGDESGDGEGGEGAGGGGGGGGMIILQSSPFCNAQRRRARSALYYHPIGSLLGETNWNGAHPRLRACMRAAHKGLRTCLRTQFHHLRAIFDVPCQSVCVMPVHHVCAS